MGWLEAAGGGDGLWRVRRIVAWAMARPAGHDNHAMPAQPVHQVLAADQYRVPRPFASFAVRSEEAEHAWLARSPYGRVHLLQLDFLDAGTLAALVSAGRAQLGQTSFAEPDYARTNWPALASAAPLRTDLAAGIARALRLTSVLGPDLADYQRAVAGRVDFLASCGAGFHNDVAHHWTRCLFWLLALEISNAEFVLPHAGLRLGLAPGDLLLFDQTLAHGLCRPADQGQAMAASFESIADGQQLFLTGELLLTDAQWAALGAPWQAVEVHECAGALDLMVAEFDDQSGTIKRLSAMRDSMKRCG